MLDRFLSKVDIDPTGCWLWRGALVDTGYGHFRVGDRAFGAHRVSFVLFRGPIPDDLELDHLCRVRRCVNPAHLEPVTKLQNAQRSRLSNAGKAHCKQGHAFTTANTRLRNTDGARICQECRRRSNRESQRRYKTRRREPAS